MLERVLITILISAVALLVYWLFNRYQKRRAAAVSQHMARPGRPRLLYFRSENCSSCLAQSHYLTRLEAEHQALIRPIDVETEAYLADQYNILTLPTTILIDGYGAVRHFNPGLTSPVKLAQQLADLQYS